MNYKIANDTKKEFPIVESFFDKENGLSVVGIQTKEGIFTGTARVHPEDFSRGAYTTLAGQEIAHLRAYINYFKYCKRLNLNTITELKHIYCVNSHTSPLGKAIFVRVLELQSKNEELKRNIELFQQRIQQKIDGLEKYYEVKNK